VRLNRIWYIGNSREKLHRVLSLLAEFLIRQDDDYELVLREHRHGRRSVEQNRRYWALLSEIAAHEVQGQRFMTDSWHEFFKGKFIGKEEVKLPWGELYNRPISTTTLDVGQFSEYMTQIEAWAAQHGIVLGDDGATLHEPQARAA